jgi:AcrR family transcriptional regulator
MTQPEPDTRQKILAAALKLFADRGYAGTSVQEIVDTACVTKPTLYYYFSNKAALYQALLDTAYDERFRFFQEAVAGGKTVEEKLTEILAVLFEYVRTHRDSLRLSFSTAFSPPGAIPAEIHYLQKSERNFEFLHSLIKAGQASGELSGQFSSVELTTGYQGMLSIYLMNELINSKSVWNRDTARKVVRLFLAGAGATKRD